MQILTHQFSMNIFFANFGFLCKCFPKPPYKEDPTQLGNAKFDATSWQTININCHSKSRWVCLSKIFKLEIGLNVKSFENDGCVF